MAHVSHSLSPIPPHLASIPVSPEFGDALKEAYARHDVQRSLSPVSPVSSSESSRTPTPTPFAKRNTPLLPYLQSSSSPSYSSSAADHRMKPRVAVRDKTPHRFQVVPLREAPRNMPPAATAIAPVGATPWSRLNVNLRNVECGGTFPRHVEPKCSEAELKLQNSAPTAQSDPKHSQESPSTQRTSHHIKSALRAPRSPTKTIGAVLGSSATTVSPPKQTVKSSHYQRQHSRSQTNNENIRGNVTSMPPDPRHSPCKTATGPIAHHRSQSHFVGTRNKTNGRNVKYHNHNLDLRASLTAKLDALTAEYADFDIGSVSQDLASLAGGKGDMVAAAVTLSSVPRISPSHSRSRSLHHAHHKQIAHSRCPSMGRKGGVHRRITSSSLEGSLNGTAARKSSTAEITTLGTSIPCLSSSASLTSTAPSLSLVAMDSTSSITMLALTTSVSDGAKDSTSPARISSSQRTDIPPSSSSSTGLSSTSRIGFRSSSSIAPSDRSFSRNFTTPVSTSCSSLAGIVSTSRAGSGSATSLVALASSASLNDVGFSASLAGISTIPTSASVGSVEVTKVTRCRKRTNTLSADPVKPAENENEDDRRRHAIWSESLFVGPAFPKGSPFVSSSEQSCVPIPPLPLAEIDQVETVEGKDIDPTRVCRARNRTTGIIGRLSLPTFPSSSAAYASPDSASRGLGLGLTALGDVGESWSLESISSLYSQESYVVPMAGAKRGTASSGREDRGTRPLRLARKTISRPNQNMRKEIGLVRHVQHPIVQQLLRDVECALEEWLAV